MVIPIYIILARLIVPFFILKWPLFGVLASSFIDLYDWHFANFKTEADYMFYQNWDKAMDLYYWIFAVAVVVKWKEKLAKWLALGFFGYRIVGMILFWMTENRAFLFFFPNFFENFFILYMAMTMFLKRKALLTSGKTLGVILVLLMVPKLIHEYCLHYLRKQPWEFYSFGGQLGYHGVVEEYLNYLFWGGLFYILPLIFLFFYLKKHK